MYREQYSNKESSIVSTGGVEAKRTIRDSVFNKLFRDKHNLVELYQVLHPNEAKPNVNDIEIVTIELVLTDGMYNDLGFSIKGQNGKVKKIILVEAQTCWDSNMAERMSIYAQKTRETYWNKIYNTCHAKTRMHTPIFEHYVIYTGNSSVNEEYLKLHNCELPKQSMNLGIKLLTKVDDTICGQYIGFCKVYTQCFEKYKSNKAKVLSETIKLCLEKGYLVEFLKNYSQEVENIMGFFRDQEKEFNDYVNEKMEEAYQKAFKDARLELDKERDELRKNAQLELDKKREELRKNAQLELDKEREKLRKNAQLELDKEREKLRKREEELLKKEEFHKDPQLEKEEIRKNTQLDLVDKKDGVVNRPVM